METIIKVLSKGSILGDDLLMILISVGSSEFPFNRLLEIIDDLCIKHVLDGKNVVAQIGCSSYAPKNYESFKMIGRQEYGDLTDKCDFIITHAGTGSVVPPLIKEKKIILFPRKACFHEHIDDHQKDLCEVFTKNHYTLCANDEEELKKSIFEIKDFTPRKFESNSKKFNCLLLQYLETHLF